MKPLSIRCRVCFLRPSICFCQSIQAIQTRTRLSVILHYRETASTTNTGRMATLGISNSELLVRGAPQSSLALDPTSWTGYRPVVLFPTEDADVLEPATQPTLLIVPDGNWRGATKMVRRDPHLDKLPKVRLPGGIAARYRLKKHANTNCLSTLESIAHAMGILEGESVKLHLLNILDQMARPIARSREGVLVMP